MFEDVSGIIPPACFSKFPHPPHYIHGGFLWLQRKVCIGVMSYAEAEALAKLRNKELLEPLDRDKIYRNHKHRMRLTSWGWNIGNQHGALSPEARLTFTCKDGCVDPRGHAYKIELQRWEYNEMVLKPKRVEQTWPG